MSRKDELIKELQKHAWGVGDNDFGFWDNSELIADFILRREREMAEKIRNPLETWRKNQWGGELEHCKCYICECITILDEIIKEAE